MNSLATSTTGTSIDPARRSWVWRSRTIVYNVPGTWRIELEVDGKLLFTGPLEVIERSATPVNRPPYPAGFRFRKDPLTEDDVPVCEVESFELADDPDYDPVRYRYLWSVNGTTVRDVTTGAKSDALARSLIARGDRIACEVTPTDGVSDAPTVRVETVVSETFSAWCVRQGVPVDPSLDTDGDGISLGHEYAVGGSPVTPDRLPLPVTGPETYWPLAIPSPAPLASWTVLFSDDLEQWVPAVSGSPSSHWLTPLPSPSLGFFTLDSDPDPDPAYSRDPADLGPATP